MKIGQAAVASGVTVKAIRHYEAVGLLGDVRRAGTYRELSMRDVDRLKLITHCRSLGFSVEEIRRVVTLVDDAEPECPPPDAMLVIVKSRSQRVRAQIAELERAANLLDETRRYLEERGVASTT